MIVCQISGFEPSKSEASNLGISPAWSGLARLWDAKSNVKNVELSNEHVDLKMI
jgi:hypothetical protein